MKENDGLYFKLIIALAVVLRFFGLTVPDVKNDSALYSVRALGWFDYLGGGQTAPIQWFGTIPGWSLLSFHDCPPLVFAIQKIFFTVFGDNVFAARAPFALAGVFAVAAVYYIVKYFKDQRVALLSAGIFSVSSYAVWASRSGYLEGVEVFFIVLSLLFFVKYLAQKKRKDLYWWSFVVGLAFLSKYTSVFLLPVGIFCLIIFEYKTLRKDWKKIFYSFLIFLGTISPVVIYNALVFKYRGHFDASFSAMVGMHPQDFSIIAARAVNISIFDNFKALVSCFPLATSWPLAVFFLFSLIYFIIKTIKKRASQSEIFILVNVLVAVIMFCFGAPAVRQVSILMPFLAIVSAIFIEDSHGYLIKNSRRLLGNIFLWFVFLILFLEFLYSFNTNILINPVGNPSWSFSSQYLSSDGWNELEEYWRNNLLPGLPAVRTVRNLEEMPLNVGDFSGKNVIFYDDNVNWFAYMWYIEKYPLYYRLPFLPVSSLLSEPDLPNSLKRFGARDFYYVANRSPEVIDAAASSNKELMEAIGRLNSQLEETKASFEEIINRQGETAFRIYHLPY